MDQGEISKYSEIVGQLTAKNISLAANSDLFYLCDDLSLRNLFTSQYGKPVFWIQIIIQYLSLKKSVPDERYLETISRLVELNFKHTHLNGQVILYYFQKKSYKLTNNSFKFLKIFRGNYCDNSAFNVALSFLNAIWHTDIDIAKKRKITFEVFFNLTIYRTFIDVDKRIQNLIPILFENSLELLNQWQKVKIYILPRDNIRS